MDGIPDRIGKKSHQCSEESLSVSPQNRQIKGDNNECRSRLTVQKSIIRLSLALVLCSSINSALAVTRSRDNKRVVCYYTNWSAYRQGPAKFLPENINPYLCTHLIYSFGGLTSDYGIKPFDKYQDIDKGGYGKFNGLKTYNKALKTLIAIGGWNEGSKRFSSLVADPDNRRTFIKHVIRFLRQHHFDGLDLDWEYPASREGGVPEDKKNYAIFIKELRESFDDESKATGRPTLLLTIAVPAGTEWIKKGFDIPVINRYVDFFNLLTYDYHASTEPNANHHAPLSVREGLSEYDWKGQLNIEYTIRYYEEQGADKNKLVVGLPTYGRSYTLFNPDSFDIEAPASGPGKKGKYTKEAGYLAYYEICEGVKSGEWKVHNGNSDVQGPHAVSNDQWVGYDDRRIMSIKSKWVKDQGLGGIMFWSVDNDDFRGTCHGKPFPLIEAAKLAYYTGKLPKDVKTGVRTTSRFSVTTKPEKKTKASEKPTRNRYYSSPPRGNSRVKETEESEESDEEYEEYYERRRNKNRRRNRNKNRRRKNRRKNKYKSNRRTTTTTTTSTTTTTQRPTTSTTIDPFNTPEPPTTPSSSGAFECKDEGFFPHPTECKKYFWCLDAPGLGLVAHRFTCPAGLFFNKLTDSCDYARNVPCKRRGAAKKASTTAAPTTTTTTKPTTTTTRRTTPRRVFKRPTTTTTPAPEDDDYSDEYYDYSDEDYYSDEDDYEPPSRTKSRKKNKHRDEADSELKDIKELLKLIRKLGGVEELEKYLEANPSVAAKLDEEDYEEVQEGDGRKTSRPSASSLLNRKNRFKSSNRFSSPSTPSRKPSSSQFTYKSISRNRNGGRNIDTSSTIPAKVEPERDMDNDEAEAEKSSVKRVYSNILNRRRENNPSTSSSSPTSRLKSKYVTLNRSKNDDNSVGEEKVVDNNDSGQTDSKKPSTETSIVVRYSDDELLPVGDKSDSDPDNDQELTGVTITKPYAKVSGAISDDKAEANERLRYVVLSKAIADSEVEETVSNDQPSDETNPPEDEGLTSPLVEETTTPQPSTTTTPLPHIRNRLRIPTRRPTSSFKRTRTFKRKKSTTTPIPEPESPSSTPSSRRTTRHYRPGNRRNLFYNRNRSSTSSLIDNGSSDANSSVAELYENSNLSEVAVTPEPSKAKRRGRYRSPKPVVTTEAPKLEEDSSLNEISTVDSRAAILRSRSRSRYTGRNRYRSSSTTTPSIRYRRVRNRDKSTTPAPRRKSTTSTTPRVTSTKRPVEIVTIKSSKPEEEDVEYYYYYYDDVSPEEIFASSQTQRSTATGLGLQTPAASTINLKSRGRSPYPLKVEIRNKGRSVAKTSTESPLLKYSRGLRKRNSKVSSTAKPFVTTEAPFVPSQIDPSSLTKKWSARAVIPLSEKVRLTKDGINVECLDKGIFPHPVSCQLFVHCAASDMNDGSIKSWVYSCPKLLTFDPIGQMCNWSPNTFSPNDNGCIE